MSKKTYGDILAQEVSGRIGGAPADSATLQAWTPAMSPDGMVVVKLDDYTLWTYEIGSSAGASSSVLVPTDARATGRWVKYSNAFLGANAFTLPVADATALAAISAGNRADGMLAVKLDDGTTWRFVAAGTATDTTSCMVIAPAAGTGVWVLHEKIVNLKLPFTFATADAATIFTVPAGARLRPHAAWWEIAVDLAGGSSSAIGVHASPTGWTTKGDILGGATGDVAAALVASNTRMAGTVGAKLDGSASGNNRLIMIAADTFKFDRITSVFTSGSGNVRILCSVLANAGA